MSRYYLTAWYNVLFGTWDVFNIFTLYTHCPSDFCAPESQFIFRWAKVTGTGSFVKKPRRKPSYSVRYSFDLEAAEEEDAEEEDWEETEDPGLDPWELASPQSLLSRIWLICFSSLLILSFCSFTTSLTSPKWGPEKINFVKDSRYMALEPDKL